MNTPEEIAYLSEHEHVVKDGGGWSNNDGSWDLTKFHCYWCLGLYDTWEESRACNCDKTGTPQQMIK